MLSVCLANAYEYRIIAETGDVVDGKTIAGYEACAVSINNRGQVAFMAQLEGETQKAVFLDNILIAKPGDTIDGITITDLVTREIAVSNTGSVAFTGFSGKQTFIFTQDRRVSSRHFGWPNDRGEFRWSQFYSPSINAVGGLASRRGHNSIYLGGSPIVGLWDAIDGKTLTGKFGPPCINKFGTVVFRAMYNQDEGTGLFTQRSLLVHTGKKIDGMVLTDLGSPAINDLGVVAFHAAFYDGATKQTGIFTPDRLVAKTSLKGHSSGIGAVDINNAGEVVFWDSGGLFTPSGVIAAPHMTIGSQRITGLGDPGLGIQIRPSINDLGQVAFTAHYAGGSMIVTATPEAPKAIFQVAADLPAPGQDMVFDASTSSGHIQRWEWDFGDGITASGDTVSHKYMEPGVYHVALTVTDIRGVVAKFEKKIVSQGIRKKDDKPSPARASNKGSVKKDVGQGDGEGVGAKDQGHDGLTAGVLVQAHGDGDEGADPKPEASPPHMDDILSFFGESTRDNSLESNTKSRRSQRRRRKAMNKFFRTAQEMIEIGSRGEACAALSHAYERVDEKEEPSKDWFEGPARPQLEKLLQDMMSHIDCQDPAAP